LRLSAVRTLGKNTDLIARLPVLNTAKLNGLDPQTYLCDVLERIVSGRTKTAPRAVGMELEGGP
jgi:hypothetical protein